MKNKTVNTNKKSRFDLFAYPETLEKVESLYKKDDCRSKSEFIEKAVDFYCGYLSADQDKKFLPSVITTLVKDNIEASDKRIVNMIFKLAVELEMTMNVVAFTNNISRESLRKLRADCIDEVKKTNGSLSFEEAYDWQHS